MNSTFFFNIIKDLLIRTTKKALNAKHLFLNYDITLVWQEKGKMYACNNCQKMEVALSGGAGPSSCTNWGSSSAEGLSGGPPLTLMETLVRGVGTWLLVLIENIMETHILCHFSRHVWSPCRQPAGSREAETNRMGSSSHLPEAPHVIVCLDVSVLQPQWGQAEHPVVVLLTLLQTLDVVLYRKFLL